MLVVWYVQRYVVFKDSNALPIFLGMLGVKLTMHCQCFSTGMFFASTMVMVTIALVMAVIVTNIYAKKDTPQRCPLWTVRLASWFYPAHFLPPRLPQMPPSLKVEEQVGVADPNNDKFDYDVGLHGDTFTQQPPGQADRADEGSPCFVWCCACEEEEPGSNERKNKQQGADECTHERGEGQRSRETTTSFTHYDGKPEYRSDFTSPYSSHYHDDDNKHDGTPSTSPHDSFETFDFERSEAEWRMVAKFTDRMFFWLFLALSVCTHSSLFLQMVPVSTLPMASGAEVQ